MRELTVFYCPGCGHYGFHHASGNTVCPICHESMKPLPMSYQSFMNLEYDMRDKIIASQIAGDVVPSSSVVQRITALEKSGESGVGTARLKSRIQELSKEAETLTFENEELRRKLKKQEQTIDWMHDLIWELIGNLRKPE